MASVDEIQDPTAATTARAPILLLATLAIVAAVGQSGLWGTFAWDDRELVVNEVILEPDAPIFGDFTAPFWNPDSAEGRASYFRPVVQTSYRLDHRVWGADPIGFHLTNLLIHLATCALLFVVCTRYGASPIAAALAGLLFGLSPRLSESVFWVSGRTDLLAGFFVMLAIALYPREGESGARRLAASAVMLLGLLSKEVAVAGIAALMTLELARWLAPTAAPQTAAGGRINTRAVELKTLLTHLGPIGLALIVYLGLRQLAIADGAHADASLAWVDRLMLSAESLGRYVLMWLDPLRPALRIGSVRAPRDPWLVGTGLLALAAALWGLRWAWRTEPSRFAVACLVMTFASLGLVLHLLPIHIDVIAADRFLYLPTLGLSAFCAVAVTGLNERRARFASALAGILVVAFSWALVQRAEVWRDELSLWLSAKQNADAHDSIPDAWIAMILLEREQPGLALLFLQNAARIESSSPLAPPRKEKALDYLARISTALSALGRDEEAVHAIEKVVRNDPDDLSARTTRVVMISRTMRLEEASGEADRMLEAPNLSASDAAQLRNVVAMGKAWQRLPEPNAGEPPSLQIARARIHEGLGAMRRAERSWQDILADPAIGESEVYEAARFFCFRSGIEAAAPVLDRLLAMNGAHFEDARILGEYLQERQRTRIAEEPPTLLASEMLALAAR
ncbi:MAG: hypothetical protein JRH16_22545 [Deltaproteobacteria bacterium]|nr:hypothetical protein [Deltaproteobacteria bacterium]MBW2396734.1 hypothetical protein [Deltaproteobacteria bacterium]